MAHDLLGDRMFVGTESAWHNLGVINPLADSFMQAVTIPQLGMDYSIHKLPLTATLPDGTIVATDSYGLVRDPIAVIEAENKYQYLGECSASYEYFQNRDVAGLLDSLLQDTGWKFSTCGVIKRGATIFMTCDMGNVSLFGDDFARYFSYIETRDGKTSAVAIASNIKIVCRNTHDLALREASSRIAIPHHSGHRNIAAWAMELVAMANKSSDVQFKAIQQLLDIAVTDEQFVSILDAIVDMPTMPRLLRPEYKSKVDPDKLKIIEQQYTYKCNNAIRLKNQITDAWVSQVDCLPEHMGTGYAVFQAVTNVVSNKVGTDPSRGKARSNNSRAEYDLFGDGLVMRNRTYEAIMTL